jgi:hypothetical protein
MTYIQIPVSELPASFVDLPRPTQIALIGLATNFYTGLQDELRAAWDAALSVDEAQKADTLREEGRKLGAAEMLAQLRERLGAGEAAAVRVATLEAAAEAEVERQVLVRIDTLRKDFELQKMTEMAELREKLASLSARESLIDHLTANVSLLTEKLEHREKQLEELVATKTKSSHAIGKAGEKEVYDMLMNGVLPEFSYAEVKNMTGVSHAADFHLKVMMSSGNRIKILIDSKKYKRAVNSDEINKLIEDVDGDPDAHAGLMISLVSPICTMKQFQIKATDKGKPILYLSFVDIATDQQAAILCWGIRALMAAVHEPCEEVSNDIKRIEELLNDICMELKDVDNMVKTHQKMIETLRSMKNAILNKIGDFHSKPEEEGDVISHITEGCITVVKATGLRCGKPVLGDGVKCRHHTSRKDKVET